MKEILRIEKASSVQRLNGLIIIGTSSEDLGGIMANKGDIIARYSNGALIDKHKYKYQRFITYLNGVLTLESSGEAIYYFDFETRVKLTDQRHYISPLERRSNFVSASITKSDAEFNKDYYVIKGKEIVAIPTFSNLLLDNYFVHGYFKEVEVYEIKTGKLLWQEKASADLPLDDRNDNFSSDNLLFIPLLEGKLLCVELTTGQRHWQWDSGIQYISYSLAGNYIYVNYGDGFYEVDKHLGQTTRNLLFKDVKGLKDFACNGMIWAYHDIVVVRRSHTGDMAVFDRASLELVGRTIVDAAGIPESPLAVHYLDGYLYVHATSSTVYIYEIEKYVKNSA